VLLSLAQTGQRLIRSVYDPVTLDELPIKYALGRIAARRTATRARLGKKPSNA
jgi:hypothetical protein